MFFFKLKVKKESVLVYKNNILKKKNNKMNFTADTLFLKLLIYTIYVFK
jgi:hypothetical protein